MKICKKLVLCFLLGAIFNVIIAWILSLTVNVSSKRTGGIIAWTQIGTTGGTTDNYGVWHVEIYRSLGSMQVHSVQYIVGKGSMGASNATAFDVYPLSLGFKDPVVIGGRQSIKWTDVETTIKIYEARGWPFLSMSCIVHDAVLYFDSTRKDISIRQRVSWYGGIVVSWNAWPYIRTRYDMINMPLRRKVLPIRPMLLGFAANSIFYACLVAVLVFLIPSLRHWYLRRNSRCIACGYILSGITSSQCPECGNSE